MRKAIGLAMLIVVLAVFVPSVLNALISFCLALLQKSTAVINALPSQPADMQVMSR